MKIIGLAGLICAARPALAQRPPSLGTAASFAVLASTVTSSGSTVVTGNLGGHSIVSFPPGVVLLGTMIGGVAAPLRNSAAAYDDLTGRPCVRPLQGDNLVPGVYCSAFPLALQGTLTLDANGDSNAVWIFQLGAGLTTAPASAVRVINGGWEGNVFWQLSGQAVIGEDTAFMGRASLAGRALVIDGAESLSVNNVSLCYEPIVVINPVAATASLLSAFNVTFTQNGGFAPVTFTLGMGALPAGLSLATNGTLSGTPTVSADIDVVTTITDSVGRTGTRIYYPPTVPAPSPWGLAVLAIFIGCVEVIAHQAGRIL